MMVAKLGTTATEFQHVSIARGAARCRPFTVPMHSPVAPGATRKESIMREYTVHFQKGTRVGTRSLRMITVEAPDAETAIDMAKLQFTRELPDWFRQRYRMVRVDHFDENGKLVID